MSESECRSRSGVVGVGVVVSKYEWLCRSKSRGVSESN